MMRERERGKKKEALLTKYSKIVEHQPTMTPGWEENLLSVFPLLNEWIILQKRIPFDPDGKHK